MGLLAKLCTSLTVLELFCNRTFWVSGRYYQKFGEWGIGKRVFICIKLSEIDSLIGDNFAHPSADVQTKCTQLCAHLARNLRQLFATPPSRTPLLGILVLCQIMKLAYGINSVQIRCIVKGEAQKSTLFWHFLRSACSVGIPLENL